MQASVTGGEQTAIRKRDDHAECHEQTDRQTDRQAVESGRECRGTAMPKEAASPHHCRALRKRERGTAGSKPRDWARARLNPVQQGGPSGITARPVWPPANSPIPPHPPSQGEATATIRALRGGGVEGLPASPLCSPARSTGCSHSAFALGVNRGCCCVTLPEPRSHARPRASTSRSIRERAPGTTAGRSKHTTE